MKKKNTYMIDATLRGGVIDDEPQLAIEGRHVHLEVMLQSALSLAHMRHIGDVLATDWCERLLEMI